MKVKFVLNGKSREVEVEGELTLSGFLRRSEGLVSVKEGCDEGECGSCMVLIDGQSKRSCQVKMEDLAGREVTTWEGIPQEVKKSFAKALSKLGLGCGFCAGGIFMHYYSFLKNYGRVERSQIMELLSHHYCRCLGYFSWPAILEELSWGEPIRRTNLKLFSSSGFHPVPRFEENEGATLLSLALLDGVPLYVDDLQPPKAVEAALIFVPAISGIMEDVDFEEVESSADEVFLLTPKTPLPQFQREVPRSAERTPSDSMELKRNYSSAQTPSNPPPAIKEEAWMERPFLRRRGEEIFSGSEVAAVVAAKNRESAQKLRKLAKFSISPMDSHLDVEYADNREWARTAHVFQWSKGKVNSAFSGAEYVVSGTWVVPFLAPNPLEPPSALAEYLGPSRLRVHTAGGDPYSLKERVASILNWPSSSIEVWQWWAGGDFGARWHSQLEEYCAFLTAREKRPVKLTLKRKETNLISPKHPYCRIHLSLACNKRGEFLGLRANVLFDTGAYSLESDRLLKLTSAHLSGLYRIPNLYFFGKTIASNNPPALPLPLDGALQIQFALESLIDLMAQQLKQDPWILRYKNLLEPGTPLPNGQPLPQSLQPTKILDAIRDHYYQNYDTAGIACAILGSGELGLLPPAVEVKLEFDSEGFCNIYLPWNDTGDGLWPVVLKTLVDTGLSAEKLRWNPSQISGEIELPAGKYQYPGISPILRALHHAVDQLRPLLNRPIRNQTIVGKWTPPSHNANLASEFPGQSSLPQFLSFSLGAAVVNVNPQSGQIQRIFSVCDLGESLNLSITASQIEGSIFRMLSWSLYESFTPVEGLPLYTSLPFSDKLLPSQLPNLEIAIIEPTELISSYTSGPFAAEVPSIALLPAISSALFHYNNRRYYRVPLKISRGGQNV